MICGGDFGDNSRLLILKKMHYNGDMMARRDNKITEHTDSLAGYLLVATPSVQESCFARSVIYMCAHNEEGAMGIIVNYSVDSIKMDDIFEQLEIDTTSGVPEMPVHFGGPVESNRGFVVHGEEYGDTQESLIRKNGIAVTASLSILQDMASGSGPKDAILVLGYAGWSPGQLESEIETGSWMVVPASQQLVFGSENEVKWSMAMASLGIDLGHYSNDIGHA